MDFIKALPEGDIDKLKAECLTKPTRTLTPKQKVWREKFKQCADQSKGKPDYRGLMKDCLKK